MKKAIAWPFELAHVLGAAFFFALGGVLTLLTAPPWLSRISHATPASAARVFDTITGALGRNVLWLAGAALVGALAAPYLRGDAKKGLAWARAVCSAVVLVIVTLAWGRLEGVGGAVAASVRSDRALTLWNALAVAACLDLALVASAVAGGAKSSEGGKK